MTIDVVGVTKRFKTFTALDHVSLTIRSGELVALLGPSGSGKTTLLRIIAGLEWPDTGEVRFDGEDALSRSVRERNVGFVFQHYALFRHMNVFENVAFGLRVRRGADKLPEAAIRGKVNELLSLVQIDWLAERYPAQLSGGQRQRVALARALAISPRVLLLDEPFGALDAKVRKELRRWLRHLHEELPVTSVLVTHDQEEALELADRVVVMGHGRIEQVGSPAEVYDDPATAFVHDFIGETIALPGEVRGGALYFGAHALGLDPQGVADGPARILARPHDVDLADPGSTPFAGKVLAVRTFGPTRRADVELAGETGAVVVEAAVPHGQTLEPGTRVGLLPRRYKVFTSPRAT
ncbi:sulfate/molybdate ABC transporter ATP-binding protein [Xanthobacter autotrophicus]|uniref:sulfate/molybdate ABC transporter ATP-binding protein n=1 Tax=Xanthobacter TaxID=279 RepID=UPI0024AA1EE1|nr:sulfate/molybdate ABC transporter ATP-binding protein [Xanthobacter autotrophicus]MDI4663918.1 sulfate/molybdate ABC transporter ATP-binding protein [Xanthobacter autotrophicus]